MDVFEPQDVAWRRSGWLVVVFVLAVAATSVLAAMAVTLATYATARRPDGDSPPQRRRMNGLG